MYKRQKKDSSLPTEDTAPQEEGIELTVNDLSALKQIIDVASSRGAFKPNEMTVIGNTYTKLESFLTAVQQQGTGTQNV